MGVTLGMALVLVLTVLQMVGVGFTFGLELAPRLEMEFWLKLEEVLALTLVEGCELGIEGSCKLGLLLGTARAGLGLTSD